MAKTRAPIVLSEEQIQQRQQDALKVLKTPIGRALMRPGTTFRHWSASSPSNIWVESKTGRYLFHSDENGYRCPVREAYATLRHFLVDTGEGEPGEKVGELDPALVALFKRQKLERVADKAPKTSVSSAGRPRKI